MTIDLDVFHKLSDVLPWVSAALLWLIYMKK